MGQVVFKKITVVAVASEIALAHGLLDVVKLQQAGPLHYLLVYHRCSFLRNFLVFKAEDPAISLMLDPHDLEPIKLQRENRMLIVGIGLSPLQNDSIA